MSQDEKNLQNIKDRICASDLDGGIKIRALFGLDREFKLNDGRCRYADVDHFFTWADQPEGQHFWSEINDVIGYDFIDTDAEDSFDEERRRDGF